MRIGVGNYPSIEIPDDLASVRSGRFDGSTPYISKLVGRLGRPSYIGDKLPRKLHCVELVKVRALVLGGYSTVAEPLAGVGLTARILANGGALHLNDADEGCRRVLALNFSHHKKPTGYDAFETNFPAADLVFLDFNDFTLKRYIAGPYQAVLSRGFEAAREFVLLNDCTPFYFRYGAGSYKVYSELLGRRVASVPDYLRAARAFYKARHPEWNLVHAAHFRDSSFQLFTRRVGKLEVEEAGPEVSVSCFGGRGTLF